MLSATCSAALMAYWLCSTTVTSMESGQLRAHVGWCSPAVADLLQELDRLESGDPVDDLVRRMEAELPQATRSYFFAVAKTFEDTRVGGTSAQRDVLLTVLETASSRRVIELAEECAHADAEPRQCASLSVVGRVGHAGEVPLLFRTVSQKGTVPSENVLEAFESSLSQVLERDSRAFASCRSLWSSGSEPVIEHVVAALGTTGGDESISLLLQILNRRVIPDETVLGRVARLAESASPEQASELRETLRDYLDPDAPMKCQIAAQALGRLSAADAVPELIDLLNAEHSGVRGSSLWALRRISTRSFRDDAARWEHWYQEELTWLDEDAPRQLDLLWSDDIALVGAALRDLAAHPLFAGDFVPEIERILDHEESVVRICAVRTLGRFARLVAEPALQYALGDWDEGVADAAREALDQLNR